MTRTSIPSKLLFPTLIAILLIGLAAGMALASGPDNAENGQGRPIDTTLSSNDEEVTGIPSTQTNQSDPASQQSPPAQENGEGDFNPETPTFVGQETETEQSVEGNMVQVFMRVAGSNFSPRDSDATFSYSGGGCMQRDSNVGDSWFTTDIQIPDGATLDFLRVYYYDNNATYDINSELWAFDGAGGTSLIAEADSSGSPGYSSAGSDFFSHPVDNVNESLVVVSSIQGGVGATLQLCGIRLRYQIPASLFAANFMPAVLRNAGP